MQYHKNRKLNIITNHCKLLYFIFHNIFRKLKINKNKSTTDFISIYLENMDKFDENQTHICANVVYIIRNLKDYSYYKAKSLISHHIYILNIIYFFFFFFFKFFF